MAKLIGDTLPPEVITALDGQQLEGKIGPAYLLLTTDADGRPRPCMLSAGEILALDQRRLRVALWPGTHTVANLERGSGAVFGFVAAGTALYIRGSARPLSPPEGTLRCFELAVESVESDSHTGMPVTRGIEFGVEERDHALVVRDWERQLAALRDAS
jgi:hypothetical protein